jgi:hypothetical protein
LRLFRCESTSAVEANVPALDPIEVAPNSGIWCLRGWTKCNLRDARKGIAASSGAELVLRMPDKRSKVILEVEQLGDVPNGFVVRDAYGGELLRGGNTGAYEIPIPRRVSPGAYFVLRFEAHGGIEAAEWGPILALVAIVWVAEDGGERTQMLVHRDDRSEGAVHLHTNGCGDFTLLARKHWIDLRGYPELDVFSMNVDAVFCWMAHHGGAREEILREPMRVFHIEHAIGSGWTPEGQDELYDRISAKGITWLSYGDVIQWACIMNRFDVPMIFNHEDWGLANETLKERAAGWSMIHPSNSLESCKE